MEDPEAECNGVRVANKIQMYRMLDAGAFGNTTARWYSLVDWERRTLGGELWAIRNAITSGGDHRTALDVPTAEVPALYRRWYGEKGGEISPMVDHILTARFQMIERHDGLHLEAVFGHPKIKWREAFRELRFLYRGLNAWGVLGCYLNWNSLSDLKEVLEAYPRHAVELTALSRNYGIFPHRNAVVWEVRDY